MQENGMREDQVTQVRGFADQSLRNKSDPEDPANRRITLIIQYRPAPERATAAEGASGGVSVAASVAKPAPDPKKR
jgi:chemotaxis protein MotB